MKRLILLLLILTLLPLPVEAAPPPPQQASLAYWREMLRQPHRAQEILVAGRAGRMLHPVDSAFSTLPTPPVLLETIPEIGVGRYRVQGDLAMSLAILNRQPGVHFAEPNYVLNLDFSPNDPYYLQYAANDTAPYGGYLNRLHMQDAWDITRGRSEIIVAVIDSGIDLDHEDIQGALWRNAGEIAGNGIDDDGDGLIDDVYGWNFAADDANVDDWHGHGSHVAGIIGARINNGIGIAGMAPKVQLMALGVFAPPGFGTYADEIKAILYAVDHGARVINLSLGSTSYSRGEEMAMQYAVQHGVVVVAAAGNNGRAIYHWPAAHPETIAVGATLANDSLASFSNRGDFVDVVAPGYAIWSLRMGGGYRTMSGTSMATPHVSGLAALILSLNPLLSPADVRSILQNTADDLGAPGRDDAYGYGRINALAALQATTPYTGAFPDQTPTWPPTAIWPSPCDNLTPAGDFETPSATWVLSGTAAISDAIALNGDASLFLAGQPSQQGSASRLLHLPAGTGSATLAFGIHIENDDRNLGNDPTDPGRDHLRAWFRTADGQPLLELLRAGNADYDLAAGLPWDRYLHVLTAGEIALLQQQGDFQLWLYADNGPDTQATRFFIDDVRFCVGQTPLHLPLQLHKAP